MLNAAISQDKDEFVNSFASELVNRINEKIGGVHKRVSKNLLQPEGEQCITQRGEKLLFDVENVHEDFWSDIYFTAKEISENSHYDPYYEFAYFIKEALEDGQVEFELADGSKAYITSEMAQQISRVHDMLSGKNQQVFRDNATLSEESFEQMMNFVQDAIEKEGESE